jgi:hypothetical protein
MSNIAWNDFTCESSVTNPTCLGQYCQEWSWKSRRSSNSRDQITWYKVRQNNALQTTWNLSLQPCNQNITSVCNTTTWNVNIPGIDTYWNNINIGAISRSSCEITSVYSASNILYCTTQTKIKLLSSDYEATFFDENNVYNSIFTFQDLRAISLDSTGRVYVVDRALNAVAGFDYNENSLDSTSWSLFTNWGGFGGKSSKTGFNSPNDLHIDSNDNVWICDTGNACVKKFTSTGTWILTIVDDIHFTLSSPPISCAVDSSLNAHILTTNGIFVYDQKGSYLTKYSFYNISQTPKKITTNHNKEILYVTFDSTVLRFFKSGVFAGSAINGVVGLSGASCAFHDEFRNLIVPFGDKIYKSVDRMILNKTKGDLPSIYWPLQAILINKEEYVQNWVYNRAFQRVWDNIEIMRHTVFFGSNACAAYVGPTYSKDLIIIGQNEIVSAAVINRILGYLWANYSTLIKYFDPSCIG